MKLTDIKTAIEFEIWFLPKTGELKVDKILSILKLGEENQYSFIQDKELKFIQPRDKSDSKDINFYLLKGVVNLCEVIQTASDGSALLRINFFNSNIIEMGEIEIGIDEKIENTAKKQGIKFRNTKELIEKLPFKFALEVYTATGYESYFLMLHGQVATHDFTDELEEIQAFSLYGDTLKVPIIKRQIDKIKTIFFATKLISNKTANSEGALRLVKAKLEFSDYTATGQIQAVTAGAMARLTNDEQSYLKKWDEYGDFEGENLLENARRVGKLQYETYQQSEEGIELFFSEHISDRLDGIKQLEITSEEPIYLKEPSMTWKEHSEYLEEKKVDKANKLSDSAYVTIKRIEPNSIILESTDENKISMEFLDKKFLILSIAGDMAQIDRRTNARNRVIEGRSANPQLGLIIEEKGEVVGINRKSYIKPLTPFVKNKIFSHNPTKIQTKAIQIALNTPDIALIQGPPGTGKTTVVTAIIERLNEEHDKSKSIRGQVLVTAFQHDAVENIISRLSINDLPTVKFGKASGFSQDEIKQKNILMVKHVISCIQDKNPQIHQMKEHEELSRWFSLYAISPSINNVKTLLKLTLNLPQNILTKKQIKNINELLNMINIQKKGNTPNLEDIKIIRGLRFLEQSFLDDGGQRAILVFDRFEEDLNEDEKQILKKAIMWRKGRDLNFLNELKEIKIKLLEIYLPVIPYKVEKPREDILTLMVEINKQIEDSNTRINKRDRILADFLYELENNPTSIEEAIEDYNYVFSATTQLAEGKDIRIAKKKFNDDEFLEYDTVIVDEAARVSPRDLLIPMTQAKKRIILVGDHRQLPHIINEEIIKKLESEEGIEDISENEYIKTSMFEYLFNRLKKLEEKDGIQRTITLDAQYRMHPLLGKFVSDNFYKKYGEEFKSPLEEKYFTHNLSKIDSNSAVWLNIPNSRGKESRDANLSRLRESEAKAIAKQLKEWIDSEEGKNLTFGVISFYKAQVNTVFDELEKFGITERDDITKDRQIVDKYKFLNDSSEERLRIGTVDSFQGMEFDVTFLSMVRTSNKGNIKRLYSLYEERLDENNILVTDELLAEKVAISLFGHLMSENRLCVSVSRQKRVLVIVGDGDLACTQIAKDNVPALSNFYNLCLKKGSILNENS